MTFYKQSCLIRFVSSRYTSNRCRKRGNLSATVCMLYSTLKTTDLQLLGLRLKKADFRCNDIL